jgi:hypothetical protein
MELLPNLSCYEMFSLVIIPFSLFFFGADFLRDSDITNNERKIGLIQYIHHFAFTTNISGLIGSFLLSSNIPLVSFLTFGSMINQVGWVLNNDNCWLTKYSNKLIGTKEKNRKWIAEISSLIKHYVRGDEWAYSGIRSFSRDKQVLISNGLLMGILIKIILKNKIKGL